MLWIRIDFGQLELDPDSGGQKRSNKHKKGIHFMFWSAGWEDCSLKVKFCQFCLLNPWIRIWSALKPMRIHKTTTLLLREDFTLAYRYGWCRIIKFRYRGILPTLLFSYLWYGTVHVFRAWFIINLLSVNGKHSFNIKLISMYSICLMSVNCVVLLYAALI